ncbi:hypothetical protein [Butyrivibrio sp. TB]|uniref:hypothetical protein n=1 Tax=Butyrivibrio sp. TB TaxID=1520809 RepID=UPI0008C12FED|nr:hypothetical protein [Butyrivibrio sp. TB]SEQ67727.1 hypothetical protein SAMN02910382_03756 [Butyrivibrio sp. TB]
MSENIDFERLRNDLMTEYGAQSAVFSGVFGFMKMCDVQDASNEKLIEMARREGLDIDKYKNI